MQQAARSPTRPHSSTWRADRAGAHRQIFTRRRSRRRKRTHRRFGSMEEKREERERSGSAIEVRGFSLPTARDRAPRRDFTIPRRGVTAIIGPSGCGKSTFLARSPAQRPDPRGPPRWRHPSGGRSVFGSAPTSWRSAAGGDVFQRPNRSPRRSTQRGLRPPLNGLVARRDSPRW